MRLAFMGTPDFAVPALRALHAAGHEVAAVYTQPPRQSGRGQSIASCPVQVAAEALGLAVRHPASLKRDPAAQAEFAALRLDAAVVAAYGLILPQAMLDVPRRGCLNIHASLLPRWRGAAPIQAAVMAGDAVTGVTIMQMDAGLDTGGMLLTGTVPIGPRSTAAELQGALATLGAALILRALAESPRPEPQPDAGSTYAPKLSRADSALDWSRPAEELDRRVRALNPWPGTTCLLLGEPLKVLEAELAAGTGAPGTVLGGLTIACGTGALRLVRVQRPGRGPVTADAFLRGMPVPPRHHPHRRAVKAGRQGGFVRNVALLIEYDGSDFAGWQRQDGVPTVQQVVEDAAAKLCGTTVPSVVAGRTDAGVHAAGQVAMLALPIRFSPERIRDALNFHMKPHPVVVLAAAPAPEGWNPRFSAIRRCYEYRILNRRPRPALELSRVWHLPHPLDHAAMADAAQLLLGRHDFTSFRAAACQAKSPLRTLDQLTVRREGDTIVVSAVARSFLHHQVRNMVGSLAQIGASRWAPHRMADILAARDRAAAGPTAPSAGLTLQSVHYEAGMPFSR